MKELDGASVKRRWLSADDDIAATVRRSEVGRGTSIATPFGSRLICYADVTASGRFLRFVEAWLARLNSPPPTRIRRSPRPRGRLRSFREEARRVIRSSVNAGPEGTRPMGWDYLDSDDEAPRFLALVELIRRHRSSSGRILDIGCAAATLWRHLPLDIRDSYVGMDVSAEALARARRHTCPRVLFVHGAAAPGVAPAIAALGPFSVVVFIEVLYYLDDPIQVVRSYGSVLDHGGLFIISLWNPRRNRVLRELLRRRLHVFDVVTVERPRGAPWELLVAQARDDLSPLRELSSAASRVSSAASDRKWWRR